MLAAVGKVLALRLVEAVVELLARRGLGRRRFALPALQVRGCDHL
jgi:hypothetical protein